MEGKEERGGCVSPRLQVTMACATSGLGGSRSPTTPTKVSALSISLKRLGSERGRAEGRAGSPCRTAHARQRWPPAA